MTTAHWPLERLAARIRQLGVECRIHPGAQGRSARMFTSGYILGCQANVLHHTASPGNSTDIAYLINGRGDGFVIANAFAPNNGGIDLIASGPTYTEGKGGPRGLIAKDGGNRVSNSLEIGNRGEFGSVYPDGQQRAVLAWSVASSEIGRDVWGWPDDAFGPDRLFSHFEWAPGRKIDPQGVSRWSPNGGMWDMGRFRADARQLSWDSNQPAPLPPPPAPAPIEDDDMPPIIWIDNTPGSDKAEYLVGGGGVAHIDGKTRNHYKALGVEVIDGTNGDVAASYRRIARGL